MQHISILLLTAFISLACQKTTIVSKDRKRPPTNQSLQNANQAADNSGRTAIWRRHLVIKRSLEQALELKNTECKELGQYDCWNSVHLNLLGGNDPYDRAQWQRPPRTSTLTPLAIERIVAWGCETRIKDDETGEPRIFKHIPLKPNQKANADNIRKQTIELYQRFHSRNPAKEEIKKIVEALKPLQGTNLAKVMCLAIGSMNEFVFY